MSIDRNMPKSNPGGKGIQYQQAALSGMHPDNRSPDGMECKYRNKRNKNEERMEEKIAKKKRKKEFRKKEIKRKKERKLA